jgi:hypothetical protein
MAHATCCGMTDVNQLPRSFQANVARLYERVLAPVLFSMPVHERLETGETDSYGLYLDRCKAMVDNYTANEANKVYVLVLIALFERQLRIWSAAVFGAAPPVDPQKEQFLKLLDAVSERTSVDIIAVDLRGTLEKAFEIGNVVRHGDGRASVRLKEIAPALFDRSRQQYVDLLPPVPTDSEWMRILPVDVKRTADAIVHYWGLADRLPRPGNQTAFNAPVT